jgi:hypothetical protein
MSNRAAFGVILLGIGVIWLLGNFNIIQVPGVWNWIPIILVAFGVWQLLNSQFEAMGSALTIITLGIMIGLIQLEIIDWAQISRAFWPGIIILIGINTIFSRKSKPITKAETTTDNNTSEDKTLSIFHIFSGGRKTPTHQDIQGVDIVTIFGSAVLNLKDIELQSKELPIDMVVAFGSTRVIVPQNWIVKDETFVIFGNSEDKRVNSTTTSDSPVLILRGSVVFGEITIE